MKKILYLVLTPLQTREQTAEGVHKKIYAQADALEMLGNKVVIASIQSDTDLLVQRNGEQTMINAENKHSLFDKLFSLAEKENIDVLYTRNIGSPDQLSLLRLFRKLSIYILLEIPTYPYWGEMSFGLKGINKFFKRIKYLIKSRLIGRNVNRIVTYSSDKRIWGTKTINISNGIDPSNIPLRNIKKGDVFRLTAVACMAYWHGFDRLIEGADVYRQKGFEKEKKINIKIVGGTSDNPEYQRLKQLVEKKGLGDIIFLPGEKFGHELNEIFDDTDICVGSLGRHRSGLKEMKALKNVEFALRGFPFCYSENNPDFDKKPYVFKVPADESPVDIQSLIRFAEDLPLSPEAIRKDMPDLRWVTQMGKVMDEIN